jgi:formylglycine-generating enzyme required for sulfatase activity
VSNNWKSTDFDQANTHPVVKVSWNDAKAFCIWLTERDQASGIIPIKYKYRLPTDSEWSVAVGLENETGGTPEEKSRNGKAMYPWGTTWPPPHGAGNYRDVSYKNSDTYKQELELTKKLVEKFAVIDPSDPPVIDGYDDGYMYTSPVGSFTPNKSGLFDMGGNVRQWCEDWYDETDHERVLRGSSWLDRKEKIKSSYRHGALPDTDGYDDWGFRVVLAE